MGNSAIRAHVETAQKTGVFQLKERGLTEVRLGGVRGGRGKGSGTVKLSEPLSSVPSRVAEADEQSQDHRPVQQQDREPTAYDYRKVHSAEESHLEQQQTKYGFG